VSAFIPLIQSANLFGPRDARPAAPDRKGQSAAEGGWGGGGARVGSASVADNGASDANGELINASLSITRADGHCGSVIFARATRLRQR
jgi:hypothetical protein